MENRRSRRNTGVATPRIEHTSSDIASQCSLRSGDIPAALASLGGYPDPAEGGPKLSCISCSTCLKNNPVNPVNPVKNKT